jgi:hypothetical protein
MKRDDLHTAIANMDDGDQITVTVQVGALRKALERGAAGPERVSTSWCAKHLGFSPRQWRSWCEGGSIEGVKKDAGGHWRIPVKEARKRLDQELHGTQPTSPSPGPKLVTDRASDRPNRRKRRGPWKKKALTGGTP